MPDLAVAPAAAAAVDAAGAHGSTADIAHHLRR